MNWLSTFKLVVFVLVQQAELAYHLIIIDAIEYWLFSVVNFAVWIRKQIFILLLLAFKYVYERIIFCHFIYRPIKLSFFVKRALNFKTYGRLNLLSAFFTKLVTAFQDQRLSFFQIIVFHANWTLHNINLVSPWLMIVIVCSFIFFFIWNFFESVEKLQPRSFFVWNWIFNFFIFLLWLATFAFRWRIILFLNFRWFYIIYEVWHFWWLF